MEEEEEEINCKGICQINGPSPEDEEEEEESKKLWIYY